jgi:hypothetical protein
VGLGSSVFPLASLAGAPIPSSLPP